MRRYVKKYLISKGIIDYNEQMKYTGSLQHDIPNLHLDKSKFLLAALRLYFDGELNSEENIRSLDNVLRYINKGNHTSEYDFNLNGLSLIELSNKYKNDIRQDSENDRKRSELIQRSNNGGYNIVPINSFEEASKYSKYTSWCVTQGKNAFDSYTRGGSRFYFCLKQGFENVQQDVNGAPLNGYGLSMIAVNVDTNGDLTRITTRYNHEFEGENNSGLCTVEQLENVLDVNFYQVFKPYTREELHSMGIVLFDEVQDLLDSGKDPEDIFDYVSGFNKGVAIVKLNYKYNFIDTNCKLLLPNQWFDWCSDFKEGFVRVGLNGKFNFIDTNGKLLLPNQWFTNVYDFHEGFARVNLKAKLNFINKKGELLSKNQWFDYCRKFNDGFSGVFLNDKWNFIDTHGKLLSPNQWFDEVYDFEDDYARVKLNDKYNFIDTKGRILSPNKWFDYVFSFDGGFAAVRLNNKYNFLKTNGELLSPNQWFDKCSSFRNGFSDIKIDDKLFKINKDGDILY